MNGMLLVVLLAIVAVSNASPVDPMIGGGAAPPAVANDGLHAVMLIASRREGDTFGTLGGGSIVSANRIITSAALVDRAAQVRIWFYRLDTEKGLTRLRSTAVWTQPSSQFVVSSRINDIAVITFKANIFLPTNIIKIVLPVAQVPAVPAGSVVSYGFTSVGSEQGTTHPLASAHTIGAACPPALNASPTHICAVATTHVLCPGDQGSGLFTGTGINRRLTGVVSIISPGCTTAGPSAFTSLNSPSVSNFLLSQQIVPVADETVPTV